MASDVYYQITVGSSTFTFLAKTISSSLGRDIVEFPLPYTKNIMLYDQITTSNEVTIQGEMQCGTGYPYATTRAARIALVALMVDDFITTMTLQGGTWNGSSFTADPTSYTWQYGSGDFCILTGVTISEENMSLNVISFSITLKVGDVL